MFYRIFSAVVIVVLMLMSNSTGFDFYGHSVIYYFHDQYISGYYSFNETLIVPRYILLSYIYEIFSKLGIPLAYIIIGLLLYPFIVILNHCESRRKNNRVEMINVIIIFTVFIAIFFYSALSLVFIFCMAYFISKNKFFLIGAFFHPLGIMMFLIISLFNKDLEIKNLVFATFLFLLFTVTMNYFQYFTSSGTLSHSKEVLEILTNPKMFNLYIERIQTKFLEFKVLLMIIIFYFIYRKINISLSINYNIFLSLLVVSSLFLSLYMIYKNKPTFLYYLVVEKNLKNYSIYGTWLDFGNKDLTISYKKMYLSRYEKYKGIVH